MTNFALVNKKHLILRAMKYKNYDEFIKALNERVSNLSVPCEIRNFADWQPNLYIKYSDMGSDEQVIKQFIKEYNEMNDSIYGNLYDLTRNEYLQGKVPCGCVYHPVPQSAEYTALRNRLFAIAEEIKACGFELKGDICNNRYAEEVQFSIWNDEIDKERNHQYHLHEDEFESENEFERKQERAYEDMIIRNSWS